MLSGGFVHVVYVDVGVVDDDGLGDWGDERGLWFGGGTQFLEFIETGVH